MRESGTVVWFRNTRGYGFLHRSEGRDIFVHFSGIDCDGYKTVKKGRRGRVRSDHRRWRPFASRTREAPVGEGSNRSEASADRVCFLIRGSFLYIAIFDWRHEQVQEIHKHLMQPKHDPAPLQHLGPMIPETNLGLTHQVVRHVEGMISSGLLGPGGRLPSERSVAIDLALSRNTVTAAYNKLEQRGVIRRIRGKGAFCCNARAENETFSWSGKISTKAHLLDEPILELLARSTSSALPYPLSAGTPSIACFPTADYHACVNKVIQADFPGALAVAPTEGQPRLRASIAKWLGVEPKRVFITSGAQEGIDLLVRCLIEPDDHAIVESPTYPGAIQCLRAAGARLIGWETEWSLDHLEKLLIRYKPKLIFTTPTFQNPTGRVMGLETRRGLLELAGRYHVPIVEDDVYSRTEMEKRPVPPSLFHLDQRSQVVSISTFSKVLAPGLRVGWIIAPLYMIKQLSLMKMRANLFTGGLNQLVMSELMENGGFARHLEKMRIKHCILRNAALEAIRPAVDGNLITVRQPSGGLYLWVKIVGNVDTDSLLVALEEKGVSVAPGRAFFPHAPKENYVRICYTGADERAVRRGVEIFADTLSNLHQAGRS